MQIKQVVKGLVANAVEAMPNGGVIRVKADNIKIGKKDNIQLKEDKYIKVSIEDSGVGIPEENLSKIFDPYFSTKERGSQKGMGLGLSICYSIINRHEGLITVDSKVGVGTTFHFYLPTYEKQN
ncbi:MAG: ATP-binding protein [Nitrospinae bacterium]|nr:ATP-binding protein [Nitrospinota bacterium]